jgi:hypothetical protein
LSRPLLYEFPATLSKKPGHLYQESGMLHANLGTPCSNLGMLHANLGTPS